MSRTWKIIFGMVVLLVVGLIFLETTQPEPLNLNPSYAEKDKIPLGSYVLFESWKQQQELSKIDIPPFEVLSKDSLAGGSYFFLNDYIVFDDNELDKVLQWVGQGNTMFISAGYFSKNLLDTLELEAQGFYQGLELTSRPKLKIDTLEYALNFDIEALAFTELDSSSTQIIGQATWEDKDDENEVRANFVKTSFENGEIYLHTTPEAFSNYFMLQDNNFKYAEAVLANLDTEKKIYWDTYYKSGKTIYTSPLYYLLGEKSLKWAYYFVLIAGVIFILFEGKRKQRTIPVVPPLKNQTYHYAQTIGGLYLEQKGYQQMSEKKIALFFEYIRTYYRLNTHVISEEFINKLAEKSNKEPEQVRSLFQQIEELENKQHISKENFLSVSRKIQHIKNTKPNGRISG